MIGRFLDWLGARYRHYERVAALGEGLVPDVEPARGFVQRLRDRSIERRALHAMIAASGEGIAPRLVRVAAAPAIDDDTMVEERPTPSAPDPPLVAMGHAIAERMAAVMSNTRLLSQLQLVDQFTVIEIHDTILDVEGSTPGNATVLANLVRIADLLSQALRASGNLHRLKAIADENADMHGAAIYLDVIKPDPPQPLEGYLPLTGGEIVGDLHVVGRLSTDPPTVGGAIDNEGSFFAPLAGSEWDAPPGPDFVQVPFAAFGGHNFGGHFDDATNRWTAPAGKAFQLSCTLAVQTASMQNQVRFEMVMRANGNAFFKKDFYLQAFSIATIPVELSVAVVDPVGTAYFDVAIRHDNLSGLSLRFIGFDSGYRSWFCAR